MDAMRITPIMLATVWALAMLACGGNSEGGDTSSSNTSSTSGGGDSLCETGCEATLAANCEAGPENQQTCVNDCEELEVGECSTEYQALQDCGQGKNITCSSAGIPTVSGCATEQNAFIACLSN